MEGNRGSEIAGVSVIAVRFPSSRPVECDAWDAASERSHPPIDPKWPPHPIPAQPRSFLGHESTLFSRAWGFLHVAWASVVAGAGGLFFPEAFEIKPARKLKSIGDRFASPRVGYEHAVHCVRSRFVWSGDGDRTTDMPTHREGKGCSCAGRVVGGVRTTNIPETH